MNTIDIYVNNEREYTIYVILNTVVNILTVTTLYGVKYNIIIN